MLPRAGYEIRSLRSEAKPHDRWLLITFIAMTAGLGLFLGLGIALTTKR